MRVIAALLVVAMLGGCFAYNAPAKKWAYFGDSILIVGGGATIAADIATRPAPCSGTYPMCPYRAPIDGTMLAGIVLATAGLVGLVINATRKNVKTSR
jgi:hypothetical protein